MNLLSTLGTRMRMADPRHVAILRGMLTVAIFALLGKLMSAAKEMAVAYRYGLSAEVDAYQFLYNLLSWPLGVWASVLTAVLVPLAVRMRQSHAEELPRFRAELSGVALIAGLALALLAWSGIRSMLLLGLGGLPDAIARLVLESLPAMSLMLPLGVVIALQSAWMLSAGRHLNTLYDCIPPLLIGAAVLAWPGGGIKPLIWGTLAGLGAHLGVLLAPAGRAISAPRFSLSSTQWPLFWEGFGIMLLGQAFMSLTTVIDQFYAVSLGTGAVATLGFANRVLSLVLALAAIAVSRATLPVFSSPDSGGGSRLQSVAFAWMRVMFLAGVAAMLACHALAPAGVGLLFERGQFSADDTRQVAEVLRFSLPQLPFYFCTMVLVSYALSQGCYRLVFWSGLIGCAGKVLGNVLLVPHLGLNGIALATTFTYALNALFFRLALARPR
ncbi:lipid II flippase MurJ [Massilia sp. BHUDP2]|uniref:lipid II flippase MurJ n=1 Tax=Massilia sp. BHUDP2 TaxID=3034505 RepID=UPI0039060816